MTDEPSAPAPVHEGTFPKLTEEQQARIAAFAHERRFADGEILWEQGDTRRSLFVVLEGKITILVGAEDVVTTHEPGQFSGDIDLLSGRPSIVKGRASGATRVLELPAERFRTLVQTDQELSEIFLRAFVLRRILLQSAGRGSVVLVGSRHSAGTLLLREFLARNEQPFGYLDVDRDPDVQKMLDGFGVGVEDVPILICQGKSVLKKPSIEEVGACLGLNRFEEGSVRDVVVAGAGPAGLAAAVYAASEGLDVVVVESNAPGGQAGSSSRIENYLGFPTGITGQELANRALVQAEKFGAEIAVTRTAVRLSCGARPYRVELGDGVRVEARTVVVATGVRYRKPDLPNLARYEGVGVYYAATPMEESLCEGEDIIVVGGGNSAGQAAMFLSRRARRLHMLVRGEGLAESMSRYLVRRIEETPNITLLTHTQIEGLDGDAHLERVTWRDAAGRRTTVNARHVFFMTGADPNTAWLRGGLVLDEAGFVKTGQDLTPEDLAQAKWPLARLPHLFEASRPGVFAVGDVRAASVKRVAAAVGEGSICIQLIHRVLAE